ncbi:MAG: transporter [Oscillospiraceae bacterium]|nr:transporter [Oscillospiraceae bacterium]
MKKDPHDVGKVEHFYRRVLHILELMIAAIAIVVLIISLGLEISRMITVSDYFDDVHTFLHNVLTIVVGLEFVRMLIDMTPANTLEVLIMATSRHIIMNHSNDWTLLIGIICIAILFAIRRFLIPKHQLTEDLVELE